MKTKNAPAFPVEVSVNENEGVKRLYKHQTFQVLRWG